MSFETNVVARFGLDWSQQVLTSLDKSRQVSTSVEKSRHVSELLLSLHNQKEAGDVSRRPKVAASGEGNKLSFRKKMEKNVFFLFEK